MTSPADRIADLQAQLNVSRRAIAVYQAIVRRACDNLVMLGRQDIARSLNHDAIKEVQTIPNALLQKGTDDDDDLAG
jgi:hypothetical protein